MKEQFLNGHFDQAANLALDRLSPMAHQDAVSQNRSIAAAIFSFSSQLTSAA